MTSNLSWLTLTCGHEEDPCTEDDVVTGLVELTGSNTQASHEEKDHAKDGEYTGRPHRSCSCTHKRTRYSLCSCHSYIYSCLTPSLYLTHTSLIMTYTHLLTCRTYRHIYTHTTPQHFARLLKCWRCSEHKLVRKPSPFPPLSLLLLSPALNVLISVLFNPSISLPNLSVTLPLSLLSLLQWGCVHPAPSFY